jgi:hypothetical protein
LVPFGKVDVGSLLKLDVSKHDVLAAIDDAALRAQPKWPPYFYGV